MIGIEARTCQAWSKTFTGLCVASWECNDYCKHEGYIMGGLCVIKIQDFGGLCMCLYDC